MVSDRNISDWKLSKIATQKKKFFFFTFFTFEVLFNGLFAPTSQSGMSNIFRDSESLGKSIGKKWSNIWNFLFGSGLKSPRKKKKFFVVAYFALQNMVETTLPPSYGIGATIRIGREMLCLPYAGLLVINPTTLFFRGGWVTQAQKLYSTWWSLAPSLKPSIRGREILCPKYDIKRWNAK